MFALVGAHLRAVPRRQSHPFPLPEGHLPACRTAGRGPLRVDPSALAAACLCHASARSRDASSHHSDSAGRIPRQSCSNPQAGAMPRSARHLSPDSDRRGGRFLYSCRRSAPLPSLQTRPPDPRRTPRPSSDSRCGHFPMRYGALIVGPCQGPRPALTPALSSVQPQCAKTCAATAPEKFFHPAAGPRSIRSTCWSATTSNLYGRKSHSIPIDSRDSVQWILSEVLRPAPTCPSSVGAPRIECSSLSEKNSDAPQKGLARRSLPAEPN